MKTIAAALSVGLRTVETYKARGMEQAQHPQPCRLVRYAIEHGWLGLLSTSAISAQRVGLVASGLRAIDRRAAIRRRTRRPARRRRARRARACRAPRADLSAWRRIEAAAVVLDDRASRRPRGSTRSRSPPSLRRACTCWSALPARRGTARSRPRPAVAPRASRSRSRPARRRAAPTLSINWREGWHEPEVVEHRRASCTASA